MAQVTTTMYTTLGPDAIGIDRPFPAAAELAADAGFDGIQVDLGYLREHGADEYRAVLDDHDLRPGSVGLPVDLTGEEAAYESDLDALPAIAAQLAAIGCTRTSTYLLSFSDERDFDENLAFHRERIEPVARALAEHDVRLGLEYLGPETVREGHAYEFVRDVDGMCDLCAAVDADNVGLLLDAWHWHTAGDSVEALESLDADDVVDVHVNDAPRGVAMDDYVDTERAMPGETGVIDIEAFLGHLDAVGYDGPVMAEPFDDDLAAMADEAAARATFESLETVRERAGLSG